MILFSSEQLTTMAAGKDGLPGVPTFVSLGGSALGSEPLTSTINMEGLFSHSSSYFVVPFTIEIHGLNAYFSTYLLSDQTTSAVTIRAQLYEAGEADRIFSPIEESLIILTPSFTAASPPGTLLRGESTMSRKVEKNAKLMLVFSATSSGPDPVNGILGYASASLVYT